MKITSINNELCLGMKYGDYITNLTCDKLITKIVQSLFIHRFVHFTNEYYALKTHLTHRLMCLWMKYKLMNEPISHKFFIL